MEITLRQIREAQQGLFKILTYPMSIKLAYRMKKIAGQLSTELKNIEEARLELIKKYGEKIKDKDGKETQQLQVPDTKIKQFTDEFESLLDEKIKINIEKIPYDCLEAIEKISPLELSTIELFIAEPVEDKKKK